MKLLKGMFSSNYEMPDNPINKLFPNRGKGIQTIIKTITPTLAEEIINTSNKRNRPIHKSMLNRLIKAIKENEWKLTGNSISFDKWGELLDGQHRLMAIAKSGIPAKCMITIGLERDVFLVIDTGGARTKGDVAAIMEFKNANIVGAIGAMVYQYNQNKSMCGGWTYPSNTKVKELLESDKDAFEESASIGKTVRELIQPSIAAFCHYLFAKKDADMAKVFFKKLKEGVLLKKGDPILVLRDFLLHTKKGTHNQISWRYDCLFYKGMECLS